MPRPHLIMITLAFLVGGGRAGADGTADGPPSLRAVAGHPYLAHDVMGPSLEVQVQGVFFPGFLFTDTDGDDVEELVRNQGQGLLLQRHDGNTPVVVDQLNLPPAYIGPLPYAAMAPYDADGDGANEVAAVAAHADGSHWRLWVVDIAAQRFLGQMDLPALDERRIDGVWDGSYLPVGELPVPGRPRRALLLACIVGYDVHGRGLLAVDPLEGTVLWRRFLDAKLSPRGTTVADLDGDGRYEVITSSTACNNLNGERLHGASDDSSRVIVLADDGRTLWQRSLGGKGTGCEARPFDIDGDGRLDLVVVAEGPERPRAALSVWTAAGERRDQLLLDGGPVHSLLCWPGSDTEPPTVYASLFNQDIVACRWRDGSLQEMQRSRRSGFPLSLVDAIGEEPGPELALIGKGRVTILDRRLEPLAAFDLARDAKASTVVSWQVPGPRPLVFANDGVNGPLVFAPAPRPLHPALFAGGGAAVLAVAGMAWRRRKRRRTGLETDPVILRGLRLELLGRIKKDNHMKSGALATLRSLSFRLEAEAVRALEEAGPPSAMAQQRIREAVAPIRHDGVPRLDQVIALGNRTGIPEHQLAVYQEQLDDLAALLTEVADQPEDAARLHPRAVALTGELEATLQRIRRHVEAHFRSDVAATVARVLAAQRDTLAAAGVEVVLSGDPAHEGVQVAVDPQDLEFVLDNLVDNAGRAMADAATRRLEISWDVVAGSVFLAVTDTGCGIAPDDWEAVFERDHSTRPGGGYGLTRSRADLQVYGAQLRVLASSPGHGTSFELTLPRSMPT